MCTRPRILRAGSLALTALLCACTAAINPATGRREIVALTPEQERELDEEGAKQIEAQMGLVRDEALNAYVTAIGSALAEHSPRRDVEYHFQIVETDDPNAFALPGGHIYVSRGLLAVANSESEIANVLGHEIGHVAARHAARRAAHQGSLGLSTVLSDLMSGGSHASHRDERISGHYVAKYARNQEREADHIGQDIAISAGIDPMGLSHFLGTLENLGRITQGFSMPQTYFATHPAARERMLEASARADTREWKRPQTAPRREWQPGFPVARTRAEFLSRVEGMVIGRPASEGVFVDELFLHPDLDFSLRFPYGWRLTNESNQVTGIAPKRDGVVLLQLDSEGDDPKEAAQGYAEREGLRLDRGKPIRVGGLPAYRAESVVPTSFGRIHAEITWIAHAGLVYRLIGGIEPGAVRKYQGLFRKFAHSFRPLTPKDRKQITELRLRVATSRPGEDIAAVSARTGNEWSTFHTAVANDLPVAGPLPEDTLVKIAVRELFVSGPDEDAASEDGPGGEGS